MSRAPFTLTAEAIYRYGRNGDAAPLVASDLRRDARDSEELLTGTWPAWLTPAKAASITDRIRRQRQAATVIDELMPHGREAVTVGCALIGSPAVGDELVATVLATLAPAVVSAVSA